MNGEQEQRPPEALGQEAPQPVFPLEPETGPAEVGEPRSGRSGALPAVLAMGAGFLLVLALTGGVLTSLRLDQDPSGTGANDSASADRSAALERRPRFEYWERQLPPTPPPEPVDRAPRPEGAVESWPHDQLADIADPNVLQPGYVPLRFESAEPVSGAPRLSVAGLDARHTVDLGSVPVSRSVQVELALNNVGDAPLIVSRVYPSMSAMAFQLGDSERGASGLLRPPVTIVPGDAVTLSLRLDPERLPEPGTRSIIVQIFSNDPAHELFDPGEPLSHEARLRVIFEARDWTELQRPVAPAELPVAPDAPRLWIPEIAVAGRGGDVLELGRLPADRPATVTMTIANLGSAILALDPDPAPRIIDRPMREIGQSEIVPGGSTTLTVTLRPPEDAAADFAVPVRRELRLKSNDPVAGEVEVALRAVFGGEAQSGVEGASSDSEAPATRPPTATPTPRSPIEFEQDARAPTPGGMRAGGAQRLWPHEEVRLATLPPVPMPGTDLYGSVWPGYPPPTTEEEWYRRAHPEDAWTPDLLAMIEDPNVIGPAFRAYRAESRIRLRGPRLAIAGLNEASTANLGWIPSDEESRIELALANVGDQTLILSRIYSGCACVRPVLEPPQERDEAGWLSPLLRLEPGERRPILIEVDPDLVQRWQAQAKFLQVFSNDDSKEPFDPEDPYSFETRFRIVFGVTPSGEAPADGGDGATSRLSPCGRAGAAAPATRFGPHPHPVAASGH